MNAQLPPEDSIELKNIFQALLAGDADKFEKAEMKQIATWKNVIGQLCKFGNYPDHAADSPKSFVAYVKRQLSFVDSDVLQQVLQEFNERSADDLLLKVAAKISGALESVPTTFQRKNPMGQKLGPPMTKTTQQLQTDWTRAGQQVFDSSYKPFLNKLFIVHLAKYSKTMDGAWAKLKPLGQTLTKIHVKKIQTDAWHDGKRYEIVLVDENAEPFVDSGQRKQNSARLD